MNKSKPYITPMSTSQHLTKSNGAPFHDPLLYHNIVKDLRYLSFRRPNLVSAIYKVNKYMQNPM